MMAAISLCGVLYLLHLLYRTAFEYKNAGDRPLAYATVRSALRSLQWVAFGIVFVLAARRSDAKFLVVFVLAGSTAHILADWWVYRRELQRHAAFQVQRNQMERGVAVEVARGMFGEEHFGDDYYKLKRKKAWLAFLLTLFLGPFGFIYWRWRITLAIFAAIVPWSLFSRLPLQRTLGFGEFRYAILLWMAVLAFVDVCRTNDKIPADHAFRNAFR